MPDKIKEKTEEDTKLPKSISVKLVPKSTLKVVPRTFTNVKNSLFYQEQHNSILNKEEAKTKWTALNLVLNDTEVNIAALNAKGKDASVKRLSLRSDGTARTSTRDDLLRGAGWLAAPVAAR